MNIEEQILLFKDTIEKLRQDVYSDLLIVDVPEWDDRKGFVGFPNKVDIEIKFRDSDKCHADVSLWRAGDKAEWDRLEIVSMDIVEGLQHRGRGRLLVKTLKEIAARAHARKISGVVLKNEHNDSTKFYRKCGFDVSEGNPPRFVMELNIIDMSSAEGQSGTVIETFGMGKHEISEEERRGFCDILERFLSGKTGNETVLIKDENVLLIDDIDIAGNVLFYYN